MDLETATTPVPDGAGGFTAEIPDGWQQGRGAYGGLVLALLVRAMEGAPDVRGRPLRTLSAALPAPVMVGPARLRVESLRVGTGVSTLSVALLQDDAVCAHGIGVFGRDREGDGWMVVPRRNVPHWRDIPAVRGLPMAPPCTSHFEWRPAGPLPFQGGEPEAIGWIRPIEAGTRRDAGYVTSLADTWWPGHFGRMTRPVPSATVSFYLQYASPLDGLDPEAPLLHVGRSESLAGGYAHERRELWGEDGRLVSINQQTLALLG